MYKNILVPVRLDHEADAAKAIAHARRLGAEDAKITLLAVVEQVPGYVAEYVTVHSQTDIKSDVKSRLRAIADGQEDLEVAVKTGKPGVTIAEFAADMDADLIVIRSRRPGARDYFLGSTASRVVRRAPCAVIVLR